MASRLVGDDHVGPRHGRGGGGARAATRAQYDARRMEPAWTRSSGTVTLSISLKEFTYNASIANCTLSGGGIAFWCAGVHRSSWAGTLRATAIREHMGSDERLGSFESVRAIFSPTAGDADECSVAAEIRHYSDAPRAFSFHTHVPNATKCKTDF